MKPRTLVILSALFAVACGRREEAGPAVGADTLGELALPPSARAPRAPQPGGAPDTLTTPTTPADTAGPGVGETVGPVPPPVLDAGAIANAYRRYYGELFAELGSSVRGNVDPELVEEAKHRTALDFGYVDVNAWDDMLADLTGAQRTEVSQKIAAANRELARELHGAPR